VVLVDRPPDAVRGFAQLLSYLARVVQVDRQYVDFGYVKAWMDVGQTVLAEPP